MKRKNVWVFLALCLIFTGIFYVLTYDIGTPGSRPDLRQISVIVRGKDAEDWATIKLGIDQAANDFNVDVSLITLSTENDVQEQAALVEREAADGAAALLVSAADSQQLASLTAGLMEKVLLVSIESPLASPRAASFITADNGEMGSMLADEIIRRGGSAQRVAIVGSADKCENILERQTALGERLEAAGCTVTVYPAYNNLSNVDTVVELIRQSDQADAIVAVDLATLQIVAQILGGVDPELRIPLYGIGSTTRIASYLEREVITALVVQNDFSIGYLGVKTAVDALDAKHVEKSVTVSCKLITLENMYNPDSQKLLFPFVR